MDRNEGIALAAIGTIGAIATTAAAVALRGARRERCPFDALDSAAEDFLTRHMVRALSRVSMSDDVCDFVARTTGPRRMFGHGYRISSPRGHSFDVWIGLNVNRLIVCYYVRTPDGSVGPEAAEGLKDLFQYTFGGAERLGYKTSYEAVAGPEAGLHSIWSTVVVEKDLLADPALQTFWAQDVAMMTQCVIRTGLRHPERVALDTASPPRPL